MFDAVTGIKFGYILCGIIWALALGFAAGNYACSLVHRLPRGRLILDKKPYCGSCGTMLETRDLFPVFSALSLHHRCRYCKTPFPVSHTWTELLVGLLFVLGFLEHGFSQQFILIAFIGVFLITLAAIHANEGIIMGRILLCVLISGMLYRVLEDHTIYGFFNGGLYAAVIGAVLWHKDIKPQGHVYAMPDAMKLLAVGGVCVGSAHLFFFLGFFSYFYTLDMLVRKLFHSPKPALITLSFGIAVMIPVLYPNLMVLW